MSLFQDIEGAAERGREAPGIHRNGTTGLIAGGKLLVGTKILWFAIGCPRHCGICWMEVGFFWSI